ncbi:putative oligopeptide transporter, OPT family [Nitrosomonas eutropha]|uniref:OPT family oligopeptide transporter n=1 Tax=Nitrosomonas TaxID=914 RepID=UPI0008970FCF|nr:MULTISPECIES: oligopeptide transporter, OPT family [Nitrosomonas]MXS79511.1 oligopeptide transporter, OPT family [Nitrosomonas sp. GH22]SDW90003.1 putative oligopeptide transporter, OPT family [Nitrosomonas eutropha]
MAPQSELTLRGIVIGIFITLIFTAANIYFGLKAGLTFATSIPAAVISMAVLRKFQHVTIQENNIVQTVASAAGTLSAIVFVLPGLIMIGWWQDFPFWMTFGICLTGGVLGVMYTIPLRRALVTNSDLPYPEGVACAEVLKVGTETGRSGNDEGNHSIGRIGLRVVIVGSISSAVFAVIVATRLFAASVSHYFNVGTRSVTGFDFSLSLALFAVGHLVGLWVGLAMLVGALVGWGWAVPHYSTLLDVANGSAAQLAQAVWSEKVRFLGAGTIGVAAVWALVKLARPVISGLQNAWRSTRMRKARHGDALPRTECDIPISIVSLVIAITIVPIIWLLMDFVRTSGLHAHVMPLVAGTTLFILLITILVAAVCGYMAGLIGSSNSPLSGIGILVIIVVSLLLMLGFGHLYPGDEAQALVAYALFATSIIFAGATIANDNLQDLKTGQLVDATPWKQQVALVIGVVAGAIIIPPVLDLLREAYSFVGAPGAEPTRALPAPQAGLISTLAQGVIENSVAWNLLGMGALIGVAAVVIDELLARTQTATRLPPLGVGLGMYLPTSTTLIVVSGALAGAVFNHCAECKSGPRADTIKQLGVLLASGMIVGESLIGVVLAAVITFSGRDAPLTLVDDEFAKTSLWLGGIAFMLLLAALYYWIMQMESQATNQNEHSITSSVNVQE